MDEKTLIDLLRKEEHILDIRYPKYSPRDIVEVNLSLFWEDKTDYLKRAILGLKNFLCDTYIIEDNLDDAARDGVEDQMAFKYGKEIYNLFQKNKLRINIILGSALSPLYRVNKYLINSNQVIEGVSRDLNDGFYGKYTHLANAERVEFVLNLEEKIFEIMKLIS